MLRILFTALFLAATPAFACEDAPETLTLRDAVYAGDVDLVESLLSDHQNAFEAGARTAEDTRCMYDTFTAMRPETFDFVADWHTTYPDSPFAQTAMAWTQYVISWNLRGSNFARDIYPQALAEFGALQRSAWELADQAYAARPRLIAASDALIKLSNPNGQQRRRDMVLSDVMVSDPNLGTLERAVGAVHKGWGGTWQVAERMCEDYAPMVPGADDKAATRCKLPSSRGFREQWDWMTATLLTGDFPELNYLLLDFIVQPDADRETAELIYSILSEDGFRDYEHSSFFDRLAAKYGLPLVTEQIWRNRRAYAENVIAVSPYDPMFLKVLSQPLMTSSIEADGTVSVRAIERPEPALTLDYARRTLVATPYDPEAWLELLNQLRLNNLIDTLDMAEPYRVNAIVFSNHDPLTLNGYIGEKVFEFDIFQQMAQGSLPEQILPMLDGVEEDRDVICPMIRAVRIKEYVCGQQDHYACKPDAMLETLIATIEDSAKQRGICSKERALPAQALAFTPVDVPQNVN